MIKKNPYPTRCLLVQSNYMFGKMVIFIFGFCCCCKYRWWFLGLWWYNMLSSFFIHFCGPFITLLNALSRVNRFGHFLMAQIKLFEFSLCIKILLETSTILSLLSAQDLTIRRIIPIKRPGPNYQTYLCK